MKLALLSGLLIFITSCSVLKNYPTDGFTIENNIVSYNGVKMAELVGIEFAYDNRKMVQELTFTVLDGSNNDKINNLIAFLHAKHPNYEIEINIPIEHIEVEKPEN